MHYGEDMDGFVAELARMTLVVGYPEAPKYTAIEPLSGELPHRVRLEVRGRLGTFLANMVVETSGGSAKRACQEATYLMMTRIREKHAFIFDGTAYHYHPSRAARGTVSDFSSASRENDTTFGRMRTVMRGLDKMHADLHRASKAMNDKKLVKIACLQDEVDRLRTENARLQGRLAPGGARIRLMPRKRITAPVRMQLPPRHVSAAPC